MLQYLNRNHSWLLPWIYIFDVLNILLRAVGLISDKAYNALNLVQDMLHGIALGFYVTRLKDFLLQRMIRPKLAADGVGLLDSTRQRAIDEITSLCIWGSIIFINLELASKQLGFGFGSVFALGGKE